MTALYQTDNDNRVPILFNQGSYPWVPAKTCFLSLALRDYFSDAGDLPDYMDPERRNWSGELVNEYKSNYIPDEFVCPYVRGGGVNTAEDAGQIQLDGTSVSTTFGLVEMKGRSESYSAWLHPKAHIDDSQAHYPHPFGLPHGRPKHGLLRWFNDDAVTPEPPGPGPLLGYKWVKHVKWSSGIDRGNRFSDPSSCTVLWCYQGEWTSWHNVIANYKNHRRGSTGGTNAIFSDTHVEWVPGTQIGWP